MLVTNKLLFLHLHKSGGTFVNVLLLRCVPSARHVGYHLPYREAPPAFRDRPVVGTVRSPWAYYVSWYHFQRSQEQPNLLFRICSNDGELGFAGTIENLVRLSSDEPRLTVLERELPATYANYGLNLTKKCIGELRERGLGFYSFLYERLYAGAERPIILQAEQLRQELRAALLELGHLPNPCADKFLREAPPLNVSQHQTPSHYYDERLARIVAECDRTIIDRYGYVL
jgi:hypothetical protein